MDEEKSRRSGVLGTLAALPPRDAPSRRTGVRSGAPLQYAFDEANLPKSAALLKAEDGRVSLVKEIALTQGRQLVRLEAAGTEQALSLLRRYEGCLIELTLHLSAPLTARETLSLRDANEGLVSLVVKTRSSVGAPEIVRSAEAKIRNARL